MRKVLPSIYVILLCLPWILITAIIVRFRFLHIIVAPILLAGFILLLLNAFVLQWEDYRTWKKFAIVLVFHFLAFVGFCFSWAYLESINVEFNEAMFLVVILAIYICPIGSILIYLACRLIKFVFVTSIETKEYIDVKKEYESLNKTNSGNLELNKE